MGVCMHEDFVTLDIRGHDLSSDVAIAEADNETVFGCIVLVLGLEYQVLAGLVVGLASAAAFVLSLEATTIGI